MPRVKSTPYKNPSATLRRRVAFGRVADPAEVARFREGRSTGHSRRQVPRGTLQRTYSFRRPVNAPTFRTTRPVEAHVMPSRTERIARIRRRGIRLPDQFDSLPHPVNQITGRSWPGENRAAPYAGVRQATDRLLGERQFPADDCALCLDALGPGHATLYCGHEFHQDCIRRHFDSARGGAMQCPICRQSVTGRIPYADESNSEDDDYFSPENVRVRAWQHAQENPEL